MSVKVAVRLRPFNAREIELQSLNCISMLNNTTIITDPKSKKPREFSFDYSFWSHDGFQVSPEGLNISTTDLYADQNKVFSCVGEEVLTNALQGYHCCLFAYGQTGSGKSYSMLGYGVNKGIVPVACEELFKKIEKTVEKVEYQLLFSMLEIYNEKIQDLLIPPNNRTQGGLKVREHKLKGVYVEGLSKHLVKDYPSIERLMDIGNRNRTIGSTLMNASSSRAHTIICLEFKQISIKKTEKLSVINLVDLAGSEKLSKTGASGDRMKEGCSINKSLTVLGCVISALAEKSTAKGKKIVVPFRDSVLTRILQNALGGNSKTVMVCAISPAEDNYEETLSTLRYADQAKKIKCCAVVNENEQDKMIRELRLENEKLKDILMKMQGKAFGGDERSKLKEMEEELIANSELIKEYEYQPEENLVQEDINITGAFLTNINEDPLLNGKALYGLKEGVTHVGKKNGNPLPEIVLGTLGIKPNHAIIRNEENLRLFIEPFDNECGETIYVNGESVLEIKALHHNDRLVFAGTACFLVKLPSENEEMQQNDNFIEEIDWEFVQRELMDNIYLEHKKLEDIQEKEREDQAQEKIKQLEEAFKQQQQETELLLERQKRDYEEHLYELELSLAEESERQKLEYEKTEAEREWNETLKNLEADRIQKELERERQKKQLLFEETVKRRKKASKLILDKKLRKNIPRITEVNLIARELHREFHLSARLEYRYSSLGEEKPLMLIEVNNYEEMSLYYWSLAKFRNRYYLIKEIFERFLETGKLVKLRKEDDPFWDPIEAIYLGTSYLRLMGLAYLVDNQADLNIIGAEGGFGQLSIELYPTDILGTCNMAENIDTLTNYIEDPGDLIGRRLDFILKINSAIFPGNQYKDVFVEYELRGSDGKMESFRTNTIFGTKCHPKFRYSFHHVVEKLDGEGLEYLLNGEIGLRIFGVGERPCQTIKETMRINEDGSLIRRLKTSRSLLMSPINKKSNLLNVLRVEKDIEEEEIVEELKKEEESPKKKITRHHPTRSIY